jgi:hypothetical protein
MGAIMITVDRYHLELIWKASGVRNCHAPARWTEQIMRLVAAGRPTTIDENNIDHRTRRIEDDKIPHRTNYMRVSYGPSPIGMQGW